MLKTVKATLLVLCTAVSSTAFASSTAQQAVTCDTTHQAVQTIQKKSKSFSGQSKDSLIINSFSPACPNVTSINEQVFASVEAGTLYVKRLPQSQSHTIEIEISGETTFNY